MSIRGDLLLAYVEILRFKKPAALEATKDLKLSGILERRFGLIETVADNFDALFPRRRLYSR